MNGLMFRLQAAVLWVAVAVALVGALGLMLFDEGAVEGLMANELEGEPLTDGIRWLYAVLGMIPLVLTAVVLLVNDQANRYVNLVAGLVLGILGLVSAAMHLAEGMVNGHTMMLVLASLIALLIAGIAWNQVRQARAAPPPVS